MYRVYGSLPLREQVASESTDSHGAEPCLQAQDEGILAGAPKIRPLSPGPAPEPGPIHAETALRVSPVTGVFRTVYISNLMMNLRTIAAVNE